MELTRKIYRGAVWNAISQFGSQGVNFLVLAILSRLLSPKEFGLVAMVTVFTAFLGYFTEFGLTPSLIQEKEISRRDCDTVFWSTVFFSFLVYGLTFFLAPAISRFYGEPGLTGVVRVLFLNFLFSPLAFIPEVLERKKLNYQKIAAADLISLFLSGAIAVCLAFQQFGLWALVVWQISMTFFRGIILIASTQWIPGFTFSTERFQKFFGAGRQFTLRNLLAYFSQNIDFLIVGKLLGPVSLGIYSLAFKISRYLPAKLYAIFGQMLFPAFSSFLEDKERVVKNFFKISLIGGFFLTPLLLGFIAGMDVFMAIVFGPEWSGAAAIVRLFGFYLVIESVSLADESILISMKKVYFLNRIKAVISILLLIIGFIASKKFGVLGMASAFSLIGVLHAFFVKKVLLGVLGLSFGAYFSRLAPVIRSVLCLGGSLAAYFFIFYDFRDKAVFLIGDVLILGVFFLFLNRKYSFFNFREKKLNFDSFLPLCAEKKK